MSQELIQDFINEILEINKELKSVSDEQIKKKVMDKLCLKNLDKQLIAFTVQRQL